MMILVAALAFAILSALVASKSPRSLMAFVALSWIALLGGFTWIYFTSVTDLASLVGVAAFGGMAGLPIAVEHDEVRNAISRYAAGFTIVATATAIAAMGAQPDAIYLEGQLLVCGQWTALFAVGGNLTAACGLRNSRHATPMYLVAGAGAALGTIAAGMGRASLADVGYAISLRSGDEIVQYAIEPIAGVEQGMRLAVGVASPNLYYAWLALVVLSAAVGIWLVWRNGEKARTIVGASVAVIVGIALFFYNSISGLTLPNAEPYLDSIKQTLLTAKVPGEAIQAAKFSGTTDLTVAFADVLPELFTLYWFAVLGVIFLVFKRDETTKESDATIERGYRRDTFVRGVIWLWLAWMLSVVFHGATFGSPGLLAASEWVSTGVSLFATGALIATWSPKNKIVEAVQTLAPGIVLGVLFIAIAISYRFGSPFGLSLTVLR